MGSLDPRIDAYIANSADFARPMLEHLRTIVHQACPQVEETVKWGMPTFMHAGSILCGMAAFKQHASFGFWKHALVVGADVPRDGMGSYGKMKSMRDMPPKMQLLADIGKAARLNEEGAKTPGARKTSKPKPVPEAPRDFIAALKQDRKAQATFASLPPSGKREYIEWIVGAKREETRQRRLVQAVEWLAEGKPRNWKYMARWNACKTREAPT